MATPVIMPRQGQSVESCIIGKWHKQPGDSVAVGDILFSYETDKAAFDEESKLDGIMLAHFFEEGDDVPCLLNVCVIGNAGETFAEFKPAEAGGEPVAETAPSVEAAPVTAAPVAEAAPVAAAANITPADTLKISPRARNLAAKEGVDPRFAQATGPDGRVIARDIAALRDSGILATPAALATGVPGGVVGTGIGGRVTTADLLNAPAASAASVASATPSTSAAVAAPTASASEYTEEKLSNLRKIIAKSMQQSLATMAQLTHHLTFDATDIMALRAELKKSAESLGLPNITLNDIVLYAVSRTLTQPTHRALNAHFLGDSIRYFQSVNLGIAVDTERGLLVPTLFNANKLSLCEIAAQAKQLAKEAQAGTLSPDLMTGATFTISNLGSLDIEIFTPVINPPQTGILGVDTITQRVREVNGQISVYPAMGLSLTYDHRALDGAPASRFLKDLKTNLEHFRLLMARG